MRIDLIFPEKGNHDSLLRMRSHPQGGTLEKLAVSVADQEVCLSWLGFLQSFPNGTSCFEWQAVGLVELAA
ncbi:hypothetical protein ACOTCQ_30750, partial [Achromobacter dolens]|uniref:hypothetical protein n=1 Tax=Achromobacter dolens TaxID=1287738 RepID=UPI003B9931CD